MNELYHMKKYIPLFLFLLSTGCSSSTKLKGNHIRIRFMDDSRQEYMLLSVRDSSLVATPLTEDSIAVVQVLGFSRIFAVDHAGSGKTWGALVGAAIGTLVGVPLGATAGSGHNVTIVPQVVLVGTAIGAGIGWLLTSGITSYYPVIPSDVRAMRLFSAFPDREPPEIEKVR
jgi:hypothetical protein